MEDLKRKEIEIQFNRLFNTADRNTEKNKETLPRLPGNIQVIRRRKGRPDRHITGTPQESTQTVMDME